ncbi:MAG: autotransporter domain-containing protein [Phascolarctobacterium sp.]|nr:autotransporter domain-containing protein [Phascolarctobacterium sp.]
MKNLFAKKLHGAVLLSLLASSLAWTNNINAAYPYLEFPTNAEYEELFSYNGHDFVKLRYVAVGNLSIYDLDRVKDIVKDYDPSTASVADYERAQQNIDFEKMPVSLNDEARKGIKNGLAYWANLLGTPKAGIPVIEIFGGESNNDNGTAFSEKVDVGDYSSTMLSCYFNLDNYSVESAALIKLQQASNKLPWEADTLRILPIADPNKRIENTIVHEMFHALGVASNVRKSITSFIVPETNKTAYQDNGNSYVASAYDSCLYDYKGTAMKDVIASGTGKIFTVPATDLEKYRSDTANFYLLYDQNYRNINGFYFTGPATSSVLTVNGQQALIAWPDGIDIVPAVSGIPINGIEKSFGFVAENSHFELQNSLQSHQLYRNWNVPMEAELAALEDMGYKLDRRLLFGSSVYNSGTADNYFTYTNTNPYYERNDAGTAYLTGTPSTQPVGIGFHVYGSYVDVTQSADLLADGSYSMGIRVDGVNNKITVAEGTKVTANGQGGMGVEIAYGKNHEVNILGTVEATGDEGRALSFDFGNNAIGNKYSYRGSYMTVKETNEYETESNLLDALKGPLAKNVNISGKVIGNNASKDNAAIYISQNALVENINFLPGAYVTGDIVCNWSPIFNWQTVFPKENVSEVPGGAILLPTGNEGDINLNFGADGSQAALNNFAMAYDGKITGKDSLRLNVVGGELNYTGAAELVSANVKSGATLSGTGIYALNKDAVYATTSTSEDDIGDIVKVDTKHPMTNAGLFINEGTVSPGTNNALGNIAITGDYLQKAGGVLAIDFDNTAASDQLIVQQDAKAKGGSAQFDGAIMLKPNAGYYNAEPITVTAVKANSYTEGNAFTASLDLSNCPTLEQNIFTDNLDGTFTLSLQHKANAYQQFAQCSLEQGVAAALDANANTATGEWQNIFAALDFSSPQKNSYALHQLSGENYSMTGLHVLNIHHLLNGLILSEETAKPETYTQENKTMGSYKDGVVSKDGVIHRTSITPFAQYNNMQSYSGHITGLLGVAEKIGPDGLTIGYHAAYARETASGKTNGKLKSNGIYLGAQMKYAPSKWGKASTYGLARLGAEDMDMHRTVAVADGYRNESDFTSWSGSIGAGAAYTTGKGKLEVKPFVGMDYTFSHQPSIDEKGSVTALHVDGETYNSLRTQFGIKLSTMQKKLDKDSNYSAYLAATWNHELLNKAGTFTAGFSELGGRWSKDIKNHGRDSLNLAAGFTFHTKNKFDLTVMAGTDMYRKDGHSVYGKVGAEWKL